MSYTCLLMVLCECACANLVSKANFNLINKTDLVIRLHIMIKISFKNSKGQKSYCKFLGVRSELLLSIYTNQILSFRGLRFFSIFFSTSVTHHTFWLPLQNSVISIDLFQ